MTHFLMNPAWLFGYDVVFKLVFALITAAVSYFAFRVYFISGQTKPRLFGIAFSLLSVSYLLQSIFAFYSFCNLHNFVSLNFLGVYFHLIFFIWGVVTLVYTVLDIDRPGLYLLLLLITLSSFIFSGSSIYLAYVLLSIMLLYIFIDYFSGCLRRKGFRKFLVPFAFGLLFLGHVHFILSIDNGVFYALGNLIELAAYVLILINLVLITIKK